MTGLVGKVKQSNNKWLGVSLHWCHRIYSHSRHIAAHLIEILIIGLLQQSAHPQWSLQRFVFQSEQIDSVRLIFTSICNSFKLWESIVNRLQMMWTQLGSACMLFIDRTKWYTVCGVVHDSHSQTHMTLWQSKHLKTCNVIMGPGKGVQAYY